jgi:hypothetical protein
MKNSYFEQALLTSFETLHCVDLNNNFNSFNSHSSCVSLQQHTLNPASGKCGESSLGFGDDSVVFGSVIIATAMDRTGTCVGGCY